MIPKIIHYCWFGGNKKPLLVKDCISSWRKYHPDWQIKEWNETNSPLELYPFAKQALAAKKYAFVSDVIRLHALFYEGGIYMDTDVEVFKSMAPLLQHNVFCGFERDRKDTVQTGVIGSMPGQPFVSDALKWYENKDFNPSDLYAFVNNAVLTRQLKEHGLNLDGSMLRSDYITLYPWEYFSPMSYKTHKIDKTANTYCIHYYSFSWGGISTKRGVIKKIIISVIGEKRFRLATTYIRDMFR